MKTIRALWKQESPLDPAFQKFHLCLREDWFLLPYELKLQRGHARALADVGIFTAAELVEVEAALTVLEERYSSTPVPESEHEDLHTWVEAQLTGLCPTLGPKIHTGRSRNDQVATLIRMALIDEAERADAALVALIETLCSQAERHAETLFPLQTHAQFAAPGSLGFWFARYASSFAKSLQRLRGMRGLWIQDCPLGSGAVAGSSIPLDRSLQAQELGFSGPSLNALESTSCRDEVLEWLAWLSGVALHCQSFAADGLAFSQTPFSWIQPTPGFSTGSSMMPNKSNPDALELIRGESNLLHAAHLQALLTLKGLPSGYNRDLQCIKPILLSATEQSRALLELLAGYAAHVQFDESAARAATAFGDIQATLRMEARVLAGESLRSAHHLEAEARSTSTAASEDAPKSGLADLERYQTVGSAAPARVLEALKQIRSRIGGAEGSTGAQE